MELQEIIRDAVNSSFVIYKNIPMTYNKYNVAVMKKLVTSGTK